MNGFVYLDNSATTKPCDSAIKAAADAMTLYWGNPSSLYDMGAQAEYKMSEARDSVAAALSCRSDEVFFTSGGTEANNLAIRGTANALKRRGKKIVTTSVEHPSVSKVCDSLEAEGFEVVRIKPESDGNIDPSKVISAVDDDTVLVSMMYVNNETGCIFPVPETARQIKAHFPGTVIHSDCVQAFGKIPTDVAKLHVDLLSASGHKIHAPKGVGFLYKSKSLHIKPIIFGGGQEKELRSGTEAVPAILALGAAVNELDTARSLKAVGEIHEYAVRRLSEIDGIVFNSPLSGSLPYILNISALHYRSETLLHFLESRRIYVSSGSACSKGKGSHVLTEMGLSADRTDSALRLSFSRYTKTSDIDALCDALRDGLKTLRRK